MTPIVAAFTGALVGVLSFAVVLGAYTATVARWSARLQTLVEIHSDEIMSLRQESHQQASILASLQTLINEHLERRPR